MSYLLHDHGGAPWVVFTGDAIFVGTRMEVGFGAAHVPGSLSIWMNGLPAFAGWYLPYDKPILLVNETNDPPPAVRYLARLGYDNIAGYLAGGMLEWHTPGMESRSIRMVSVQSLCTALDREENIALVDVRSDDERMHHGRLAVALEIHVTQIPRRIAEIPQDRAVYIFCGTGLRSMMAARLLQREGYGNLVVVLGGWPAGTQPPVPSSDECFSSADEPEPH